ncbi:putative beta-D-glucoside glucohydrolase protein [Rutstroemia sp. NJR-2017a BBW]|nr:putative beta-D-glucoside glucohydrolase protein [Rutstroemia sp. NJR-2017a BBW]
MYLLLPALLVLATTSSAAPGDGDWAAAYAKAATALAKLTNTNKVALVTGVGWQKGPCVGNTAAIPAIGYPQFCLQDGPLGVRYAQQVTAFPAGITTGSTWDTGLMYARQEAKALGVHNQLGPVAGPLGKIPTAGRNWEGFSNDPYLSGEAMRNELIINFNSRQSTVCKRQASKHAPNIIVSQLTDVPSSKVGVESNSKYTVGNEQELNRDTMSANINDRTTHELYLWPFAEAVKANVTSVMCSYNKFNTTWSCENQALLTTLLKNELDFQGYVVSDLDDVQTSKYIDGLHTDWAAQHTTVGSANAGLVSLTVDGDGSKVDEEYRI